MSANRYRMQHTDIMGCVEDARATVDNSEGTWVSYMDYVELQCRLDKLESKLKHNSD